MALYIAFLIAIGVIAISCSEKRVPVPRPTAYPRIERLYDTAYTCAYRPLNIMLNKNAEITGNANGFRVRYSGYGASIYCSYSNSDNTRDFAETLQKREDRVIMDAGNEKPEVYKLNNDNGKCFSKIYYTLENSITPIHFISTDSISHIVSGTLVIDNATNPDSIAPIVSYLNDDISYLIQHLNFDNSNRK